MVALAPRSRREAIRPIGEDPGGETDDQQGRHAEGQGETDQDRRVREIEDEPSEDDLLAGEGDRVEQGGRGEPRESGKTQDGGLGARHRPGHRITARRDHGIGGTRDPPIVERRTAGGRRDGALSAAARPRGRQADGALVERRRARRAPPILEVGARARPAERVHVDADRRVGAQGRQLAEQERAVVLGRERRGQARGAPHGHDPVVARAGMCSRWR